MGRQEEYIDGHDWVTIVPVKSSLLSNSSSGESEELLLGESKVECEAAKSSLSPRSGKAELSGRPGVSVSVRWVWRAIIGRSEGPKTQRTKQKTKKKSVRN